jgi:hypothetical protein
MVCCQYIFVGKSGNNVQFVVTAGGRCQDELITVERNCVDLGNALIDPGIANNNIGHVMNQEVFR